MKQFKTYQRNMRNLHKLKLSFLGTVLIWIVCFIANSTEGLNLAMDPDVDRDIIELISSKGYPVEMHEVTTADGYILTLLRIPSFKQKRIANNCNQTPVLLVHGILVDSASWVINYPNQSLGFILADKGYDVFLGNMRGTKMSKRHRYFTSDSPQFWSFGLEEIAMFDLPALIDAVLKIAKEDQLVYIGESQGTTVGFILLSQKLEYNKKIKLFIALAPVTTLYHMTSVVRIFIPFRDIIALCLKILGQYELNFSIMDSDIIQRMMCNIKYDYDCKKEMLMISDFDQGQLNMTRYPVYEKHLFSSTSAKVLYHMSQLQASKYFQAYDYGVTRNLQVYNRTTPPVYNVTKITTPVILVWAEKDTFSDPRDVKSLQKQLQNVVWSYQVPRKSFNHKDYILALDVKDTLYETLISNTCNYITWLTGAGI